MDEYQYRPLTGTGFAADSVDDPMAVQSSLSLLHRGHTETVALDSTRALRRPRRGVDKDRRLGLQARGGVAR
jgi:hypothetical protein